MKTRVTSVKAAPPGWEDDPAFVYIGRAGKGLSGPWGNPYTGLPREESIATYEKWMAVRLMLEPQLRTDVARLSGKTLVCFCFPLPCHGDVLARLADQYAAMEKLGAYLSAHGHGPTTTLDPED